MLQRKICTTIFYFITTNVSQSFKENNETNVERLNNYLKLLELPSEKHSFSDFMSCNFENHTFLKTNN